MWKTKYSWPFFISVILSVVWWAWVISTDEIKELAYIYLDAIDLIFVLGIWIWIIFVSIFYMRLNRFEGDFFGQLLAMMVIVPLCLGGLAYMGSVIVKVFLALTLGGITAFCYLNRYLGKPKEDRHWSDKAKLAMVVLLIMLGCRQVITLVTDTPQIAPWAGLLINLLLLSLLVINLYDLQRRAQLAEIKELEYLIKRVGDEKS